MDNILSEVLMNVLLVIVLYVIYDAYTHKDD